MSDTDTKRSVCIVREAGDGLHIRAVPEVMDAHRANMNDAAAVVEAIADERWEDARALAAAVSRRSEAAIIAGEGEEPQS